MSALQRFLQVQIPRHGWSIEEFCRKTGISTSLGYNIVRDGRDNVRQGTFDKIASTFGLTPAELAKAIGKGPPTDDPVELAIRQRSAELREVLERIPRPMWDTVITATFDRAIETARDMATLLSQHKRQKA